MKLFLPLFLILPLVSLAQKKKLRCEDGEISEIFALNKDSLLHGRYSYFSCRPTHFKLKKGKYVNGKMDSRWVYFSYIGRNKEKILSYKEDILHGKARYYGRDGYLDSVLVYRNGVLRNKKWFENTVSGFIREEFDKEGALVKRDTSFTD